jgi:hypothetical protein
MRIEYASVFKYMVSYTHVSRIGVKVVARVSLMHIKRLYLSLMRNLNHFVHIVSYECNMNEYVEIFIRRAT